MDNKENPIVKEKRTNINTRIKESLLLKIKERQQLDKKTPDEFFSDMFYSYLKSEAQKNEEADFSEDIKELEVATSRMVSIFQNMLEKTYIQTSIVKENHNMEIEDIKNNILKEYENKIKILEKDKEKIQKEYDLISEQAEGLIMDSRSLKENLELIKKTNNQNEELLSTYREQIKSLKAEKSLLEQKEEDLIPRALLDAELLKKDRLLLDKEILFQKELASFQEKYNKLNSDYLELSSKYNAECKQQ